MQDDQVFQPNPLPIGGDIAPTGFFDPLGLSNGKDIYTLKQWREAELKVINKNSLFIRFLILIIIYIIN